MKVIGEGAEARIERDGSIVRKVRPEKQYRHPDLDHRLRRFRTRREAKVLSKVGVPGLRRMDDKNMVVEMDFLEGPQLRDVLDKDNTERFGKELGALVRSLHDQGIIHGDLTTSNVLLVDGKLRLIDFGLSFFSEDVEDKAVDLHLLMHALSSKHPELAVWDAVLEGYGKDDAVRERLEQVELRGRYKHKDTGKHSKRL